MCLADQCRCTKTQEGGHNVERANNDSGPDYGCTCSLRIWYGIEAHQYMGQTGCTKDQCNTQRDEIKLSVLPMIFNTRLCEVFHNRCSPIGAEFCFSVKCAYRTIFTSKLKNVVEEGGKGEVVVRQNQSR